MSLFLTLCIPLTGGWLDRKAEGWAWYEEPKRKEDELPTPSQNSTTAAEQLADVRKELEELLAEAILNPTPANTLRYMEANQEWLLRSAEFSQTERFA